MFHGQHAPRVLRLRFERRLEQTRHGEAVGSHLCSQVRARSLGVGALGAIGLILSFLLFCLLMYMLHEASCCCTLRSRDQRLMSLRLPGKYRKCPRVTRVVYS